MEKLGALVPYTSISPLKAKYRVFFCFRIINFLKSKIQLTNMSFANNYLTMLKMLLLDKRGCERAGAHLAALSSPI